MLQTLLASGALLQGFKAEMAYKAQRFGIVAACAIIALVFASIGLMALAIAGAIMLTPYLGAAGAAALVGGVALLVAALVMWAATRPPPAPAVVAAPAYVAPVASPAFAGAGLANALPALSAAATAAPVPLMVGALVLGIVLGRRS